MVSSYNSYKIKFLSFISILLVLYIHSTYVEVENGYHIARIVQTVGHNVGLLAVPLFFIISGFFFFVGVEKMIDIFPRIKKDFILCSFHILFGT